MGLGDFVDLDLTIVRGLAYYTGTVFELFDAGGELRAICGGGRYDNLLQALGGVDLPALGLRHGRRGAGRAAEGARAAPVAPAAGWTCFVAAVDAPRTSVARRSALAHELRDAGFGVEYALAPQAHRQAAQAGRRARRRACAVVIGPDDRARGEVQLKDLGNAAPSEAVPSAAPVDTRCWHG